MLSVHHIMAPSAKLRAYVLAYATSSDPEFAAPRHTYRFFPSSETMLVWHGQGTWSEGLRDFGEVSRARLVLMRPGVTLCACPTAQGSLVALLRPGALRRLIGISAHTLPPEEVPLEDILGVEAITLAERMATRASAAGRARLLEGWMVGRFARTRLSRSPCVRLCASVKASGARSVRELADVAGLSERQLRKHFVADLGLSPKRYLSMRRLRVALAGAEDPTLPWTDVAHSSGYCDQSHMIRAFGDLLGVTPEGFRGLATRSERLLDGLATPIEAE
jgi:AraC-like DNA-binding protein